MPTPRHRLSARADRPGQSVLLVGWGLRTWGRGRLRACWLGHAVAVSGRWVWCGGPVREVPSAGARSLGLLGLAPLWRSSAVLPGPLPGCLPPTNAVAVRSSSTFPESWGLRTGSGPCGGLRVGLGGARPLAGEVCPWQARIQGACVLLPQGPQLGSRPLRLLPAGTCAGTRAGGCWGAGRQPAFVLSPSWSPARLWEASDAGEESPPSSGVL